MFVYVCIVISKAGSPVNVVMWHTARCGCAVYFIYLLFIIYLLLFICNFTRV